MEQQALTNWTRETVAAKLSSDPRWVERALIGLFNRQTASEQTSDQTTQKNGVGFTGVDAEFFSSLAKQVAISTWPIGKRLSPGQLRCCWKATGKAKTARIARYAGQVLDMIESGESRAIPDQQALIPEAAPVTIPCERCAGTGKYVTRVENGVPTGPGGDCYRCEGKGQQTPADQKRNAAYDRYAVRQVA